MPRKPRSNQPGVVYHLISRFVEREWFIKEEEEREYYVRLLGRALSESDWRCLAYAVMSNHIHLPRSPVSKASIRGSAAFIRRLPTLVVIARVAGPPRRRGTPDDIGHLRVGERVLVRREQHQREGVLAR